MRLLAALLFALTSLSSCAAEPELTGRVIKVADGDTVTILDSTNTQHKIRLLGIDAPEKAQAFGERSKQALSDDVFGQTVTIDANKRDKYGRIVGKIILNGNDMNLRQVERGMAWHYKKFENEQEVEDRARYAQAEDQARINKRGLWVDKEPIAPWDWRKQKREQRSKME